MASGYIENFSCGDVGIVIAGRESEVSVRLNREDFLKVMGELIDKAVQMGIYKDKTIIDKPKPAPSCSVTKFPSKKPRQPDPRIHGNSDPDAEVCAS